MKKLIAILPEENNYIEARNQMNQMDYLNIKYVKLKERLKKLRRLIMALHYNLSIYYKFLSPIISSSFITATVWVILVIFATVKILFYENIC